MLLSERVIFQLNVLSFFRLVQIGFLKTLYFGQHNEDGTLINPIMPLNTLSLGLLRGYKQSLDPVILDSKMNAQKKKKEA